MTESQPAANAASDDRPEPDADRVEHRADALLPEEQVAGSDDPELQAEAILADSDERTEHPERTARASEQTPTN
jgi:hypothetical protein